MDNVLRRKVNKKGDRTAMLFMLYAIITIIAYTLPMLKITLPYMGVALLLLASLAFFMYKNVKWMYFVIVLCITSVIVMAINMMTGVQDLVGAMNEMIKNIRFFIPFLWGCYAIKNCNEKQRKFVLIAFGILCAYILVNTLQALAENPTIARELAKSTSRESAERNAYRMNNVGGFEFSYLMGIVTIGLVWNSINAKDIKLRIVSIVAAVIGYYFIIQTMYTLLLILTVMGTVLVVFYKTKSTIIRFCLILSAVALLFFMEPFLKLLADLFSFNFGLQEKFTSMYLAVKFDDVDMVGSRPGMLKAAFLNWTEHPLLGGRHAVDSNAHSLIMTCLETSGLVGFGLWIGFFATGWKMVKKELHKKQIEVALFDCAMIYVLVLSFFNPIGYHFEIVFTAFFIVPIWSSLVNTSEEAVKIRRKRI
ncbi:MAG: hypothetical protein E7533_02750 [Ruminococcaceae bacterium]|nr:hypothetical protein [Oscillospiraceae bacterium]